VPIPFRVRTGRAGNAALVQLAGYPRDAAPGKTLGEHPPHVPRGFRIRIQPLPPPSPRRVRPIRMRTRIHQPVPVGRATAQVPALLDRLRGHRGHRPMT
jgi:hypothetical protein